MDFNDTPEEAAYRAAARAWLEAERAPSAAERGAAIEDDDEHDDMARAKAWQAKKAAAGYACITWPKEWGGGGGTPMAVGDLRPGGGQVRRRLRQFPDRPGHVRADGDDRRRRGRPNSASSARPCAARRSGASCSPNPRAVRTWPPPAPAPCRDGDDWIINGQKVWTSGAHYSDFGIVIVRTDPEAPKHKGLTMFWIDMKAPGVEVRPIHQMSGASNFNEVYFTDVRVKDSQRLGAVGDGWRVSLVTLMNERLAVGGGTGLDYPHGHGPGPRGADHWPARASRTGLAREGRRLVRAGRGPEAHPPPHQDRPVARPDPGAGKLDRQDGRRHPDAGHGQRGAGAGGPVRDHRRSGDWPRWPPLSRRR